MNHPQPAQGGKRVGRLANLVAQLLSPDVGVFDLRVGIALGGDQTGSTRGVEIQLVFGSLGPLGQGFEQGQSVAQVFERFDIGRAFKRALTGPFPGWLGSLTRLRNLFLAGNDLTGPIRGALEGLSNLERLDLTYNWGLSGPLPPRERLPRLEEAGLLVTQACAPAGWHGDAADDGAEIELDARPCESDGDAVIDVAVFHTPAARAAAGGAAAIAAVIDLMFAETNQAYAASGVRHRVRLVERSEVQYTETDDIHTDIQRLEDPSDGYMDGVHTVRDRVGADLVHLVHERPEAAQFGGVARRNGPFGISSREGGGSTFAHEVGHNMGLAHDRYQVYQKYGKAEPHPAYGYVNPLGLAAGAARARRWRTIMAYRDQCEDAYTHCSQPLRFSNARQRYNGDPLGVSPDAGSSGATGPADAAAVLNATGPALALWRDRPGANRAPTAAGTLPDRELTPGGTLAVDVSPAFVDPDGDSLTYTVSSSAPDVVTVRAAGPRVTLTAVAAGRARVQVTATDAGGLSATQAFTVTVATAGTVPTRFTDDPIVPGVTPIRAVHFAELRTRIDGVRAAAGLPRSGWTDPVLRPGVTPVRLAHLVELRIALAAAYAAAGRPAPRWTDTAPLGGATPIKAVHLTELRAAVVALE